MSQRSASRDQRRYRRVVPGRDAPVCVDINGEGFVDIARAEDIGVGGLRLRVGHGFAARAIDDVVDLIVSLPAPVNRSLSLNGRIRHLSDGSFGISFLAVSGADRRRLARYVAYRLARTSWWKRVRYALGMY